MPESLQMTIFDFMSDEEIEEFIHGNKGKEPNEEAPKDINE